MSIWNFFGKDPKELFLSFEPQVSGWRVVTWNFDLKEPGTRMWTVEAHGDVNKLIHWEKRDVSELRFFENDRMIRKRRIPEPGDAWKALMNLTIHATLKFSLETNHEFMVSPVTGALTSDIQTESKALQWIQASFGMLTRALDNLKNNPDQILTAACFSGSVPETGENVLRLIIFNLDIFYYLRDDNSLQVVIFDDKSMGHGQSKAPTFQQIIKVTKPQFYDEITKLLHHVALVGEIG